MSTFSERLRLVPEFRSDERDGIVEVLFGRLERRLEHWKADQVELELSVKVRDDLFRQLNRHVTRREDARRG